MKTKLKKRKHWHDYPSDVTLYGYLKYKDVSYGMGVYRFSPKTYKTLEIWLDYEVATEDEVKRYKKYLKEKGWKE